MVAYLASLFLRFGFLQRVRFELLRALPCVSILFDGHPALGPNPDHFQAALELAVRCFHSMSKAQSLACFFFRELKWEP